LLPPPPPLDNPLLELPEPDAPELEPMMTAPELEPPPELEAATPPSSPPLVLPEKPGGIGCGLRLHPAARATPLRTVETQRRRRGERWGRFDTDFIK
jgi:hypothetical protein